jgi:hypothetical protein
MAIRDKRVAIEREGKMKRLIGFAVGLLALSPLCSAHHSFAAEFDSKDIVTIKGTITKFEWMNPHSYFYVDVPDSSGKMVNWAVEGRNLSIMSRMGWTKSTLQKGEAVTVTLYRHKDAAKNMGFVRAITKTDGTVLEVMMIGGN